MVIQLVVLFLISSCAVCNGQSEWTICVYMSGDNNLDDSTVPNLKQMKQASTDSSKLVFYVRVDRSEKYEKLALDPIMVPFTPGTQDLYIADGWAYPAQDLGEKNMDDPNVFLDFLNTCISNYPAEKYGLIMWDHGGAYTGFGDDEHKQKRTQKRAGINDVTIQNTITAALQQNGLDKFDLFGYDACLMSYVGSIYYASLVSKYHIASMELEPGHGWDWTAFGKIIENREVSVPELTTEIIKKYVAKADSEGTMRISLISLDLSKHFAFQDAIIKLANYMVSCNTDENLLRLITRAKEISCIPGISEIGEKDSFNLVDLQVLTNIKNSKNPDFTTFPSQFQTLVSNCIDALRAMTIYYGTDDILKDTLGISIYWPQNPPIKISYDTNDGPYDAWKNFISAYHDAHTKIKPIINSLVLDSIVVATDPNFFLASATVSPMTSVSYADVTWGYAVSGKEYLFGWAEAKPDWWSSSIKGNAVNAVLAYCKDSKDIKTCAPAYTKWKYGVYGVTKYYLSGTFVLYYYQKSQNTFYHVSYVISYDWTGAPKQEYFITDDFGFKSGLKPEVGDVFYPIIVDTNYNTFEPTNGFSVTEIGKIPTPTQFKLTVWTCSILFEIEARDISGTATIAAGHYTVPSCTPNNYLVPVTTHWLTTEGTTVASTGDSFQDETEEPHRQTPWYLNSSLVIGVSVGAVACALIIVAIVVGLVIIRLKIKKYQIVDNTLTETLT